jgi:hypothetical protein
MDHNVHVRPIANADSKMRFSGGLLDQARGQLALGNVGLALESFRTLQREQPDSADALAGIATCYASMGRYDLARLNYELALAYAPQDPRLLTALASSLAHLGEGDLAVQVQAEAAHLSSPAATPLPMAQPAVTAAGVPRVGSITVQLPQASKAVAAKESPPTQIAAPKLGLAAVAVSAAAIASPRSAAFEAVNKPVMLEAAAPSSISPPLPSPSPATPARIVRQQVAAPEPVRPIELSAAASLAASGPRLERTSRSEVALITAPQPRQMALLDRIPLKQQMSSAARPIPAPAAPVRPPLRPVLATMVQWLPLKYASGTQNVQLLNAARSHGLAGQTRTALVNRGWRKIGVGNAREVRQRSLVLYAPARALIARRLAMQFHCKAVKVAGLRSVVVLLGRDVLLRRSAIARA